MVPVLWSVCNAVERDTGKTDAAGSALSASLHDRIAASVPEDTAMFEPSCSGTRPVPPSVVAAD